MLQKLAIKNYALIHDLEIDFCRGFSVITGETGAGKSIILGALSLILGQRADSNVLLNKSLKCIIEGTFNIENYHLDEFFIAHDLDQDNIAILRREINPQGKSRAFINDSPVGLSVLKDLGDRLVNIHSQNAIITLNDTNFQLAVLDSYTGHLEDVAKYRTGFLELQKFENELNFLQEKDIKAREERDYFSFLLHELNRIELKIGEQDELEHRLQLLTHAEEIKSGLYKSTEILAQDEFNVLSRLSEVIHHLHSVSSFQEAILDIQERLQSNLIDIKDIASSIERINDKIFFNPAEIENTSTRLDQIYQLEKKHKVTTVDELLNIKYNIENKLSEGEYLEEKIKRVKSTIENISTRLLKTAEMISKARKKAIPAFEKEMVKLSSRLGMHNANLIIECKSQPELSKDGLDRIHFLFSANKGVEPNEISKIASGGERSRLMLCIKSMVSQKNLLPTIIFDEIDIGVSGEIAGKVGDILKKMSSHMQVIAITHLPQIAGKGEWHYKVYKTEKQDFTTSYIKQLSAKERMEEIAKMLSNDKVTNAALQTAKELLNS